MHSVQPAVAMRLAEDVDDAPIVGKIPQLVAWRIGLEDRRHLGFDGLRITGCFGFEFALNSWRNLPGGIHYRPQPQRERLPFVCLLDGGSKLRPRNTAGLLEGPFLHLLQHAGVLARDSLIFAFCHRGGADTLQTDSLLPSPRLAVRHDCAPDRYAPILAQ